MAEAVVVRAADSTDKTRAAKSSNLTALVVELGVPFRPERHTYFVDSTVDVLLLATGAPRLELLEEIVALVVNKDEGGEVLHGYLPDGFHAEFGILHTFDALDAALRQNCSHATNGAEVEADQRHQGLEAAEPDAAGHGILKSRLLHGKALADGYRHGIHADAYSQHQKLDDPHKKTSVP